MIETIFFYHPGVWWASRVVRIEREHCCDDIAVATDCDATDLARALFVVEETRSGGGSELLVPAADGGKLLRRVRRLIGTANDDRFARRSWVAGVLTLSVLLAIGLVSSNVIESTSAQTLAKEDVAGENEANKSESVDVVDNQEDQPTVNKDQADQADQVSDGDGVVKFGNEYYLQLAEIGGFARGENQEQEQDQQTVKSRTMEDRELDEQSEDVSGTIGPLKPEQFAERFRLEGVFSRGAQLSVETEGQRIGAKKGLTVTGGTKTDQSNEDALPKAPTEVSWPVEQYKSFANYPASGTGIRVKLDDQRWVELNSLATSGTKFNGRDGKIVWRPDGELVSPPDGFDAKELIPDREGPSMPDVNREAVIQIVTPKAAAFSIRTGGRIGLS